MVATDRANPDFVDLARGFGFDACQIEQDADKACLARGHRIEELCPIEVVTDLELISPNTR